jgi:hypothetical protein
MVITVASSKRRKMSDHVAVDVPWQSVLSHTTTLPSITLFLHKKDLVPELGFELTNRQAGLTFPALLVR